jgi:hypothetical protein
VPVEPPLGAADTPGEPTGLVPSPDARPAFSGAPDPEKAASDDVDDDPQPAMAAVPRTTRAKSERFVSILMEDPDCSARAGEPLMAEAP